MSSLFIHIRFLDIVDILLVAILIYELYRLVRGTVTFTIFLGIFMVFAVWLAVRALKMELLGSILGQLFGVGFIAIIIVFQQEVRKFLLMLGTKYKSNKRLSLNSFFSEQFGVVSESGLRAIVDSCHDMSQTKTGALIVIARNNQLDEYIQTGTTLDSEISTELLKSIFFKNSPLHDGAVIIGSNRIKAARSILPVSQSQEIGSSLGLRHRAAIGITEQTDALTIAVSEETGRISIAQSGTLRENIEPEELFKILELE